jgi:predicted dehydrogenase
MGGTPRENRAEIGVGIIGATPERGWAARAHVPALRALTGYRLVAVGTSRRESAEKAAREFGAKHAFTEAGELSRHPDVGLVVVTVKVPAHLELVRAAIDAGKHVLCEWPLARTTKEAESLTKAAQAAGVHDTIGLQARYSPAVRHARELIADGYVGRVTSITVHATRSKGSGDEIPEWSAYTFQTINAAGLLEVAGGHTIDLIEHLAGGFTELSAELALRRRARTSAETGRAIEVTSPDHLLLHGHLTGDAVVSLHLHDAKVGAAGTTIEIAGTQGDLALVSIGGNAGLGVQIGALGLLGARGGERRELVIADDDFGVDTEAANVAGLYTELAKDIRAGTRLTPGFAHGVELHRLLDTVRISAETGTRRAVRL